MIEFALGAPDTSELARDAVVGILTTEFGNQQAAQPGLFEYELGSIVTRELYVPWGHAQLPSRGVVNVWWDQTAYDSGNIVARMQGPCTINVDCYASQAADGETAGDEASAISAQTIARFVRQILAADQYAVLGLRGRVARRQITSVKSFKPEAQNQQQSHVFATRVTLDVSVVDLGAEDSGQPIEQINATANTVGGASINVQVP